MLFGRVRLRINQQQISLTREMFGLKYHRSRPSPRQNITMVQCTRRLFNRGFWGQREEIDPHLIIWAGTQKYELGGSKGFMSNFYASLTEPELDWLAHELSEWLGMRMTRDYLPPSDK